MTLFADLVATSQQVAAMPARTAKIAEIAALLGRLDPDEIEPAVALLTGEPRQGRIGVGWVTAGQIEGRADGPSLAIVEVDGALTELAATTGAGSRARREAVIDQLAARLTEPEADFMRHVLTGEIRQGALAGVMAEAVGRASDVPAAVVRRAAMLSGDLPTIARLSITGGRPALDAVRLRVGTPVQPMLASTAGDPAEAIAATGVASVEWKLDGIRLQAHRDRHEVRLFTRNLNDITDRLPDVVDELRALPVHSVVLDGEVIGVDEQGVPHLFQDSMGSIGRQSEPGPLTTVASWFDVLSVDGRELLDLPLSERLDVLGRIQGLRRIPSVRTSEGDVASQVLDDALAAGHEGIMVKALDSPYLAGRRGKAWRKIKPVHTLDLVVLAVEWGSGRRRGLLSNLHLGALDASGTPVMVGKTFKGLTDELLEWQTKRFLELETGREGHVVHVRPEQVVEIAVDSAQISTRYPGGVTLRFARVRRYRDDKSAVEADTLDAVRALLPR